MVNNTNKRTLSLTMAKWSGERCDNSDAALLPDARARITVRTSPCRCGCNGRDPWHRQSYVRTLRERVAVDIRLDDLCGHPRRVAEVAIVSLPGRGEVVVQRTEVYDPARDRWSDLGWKVREVRS